jgi:hypothetical protein
VIVAGEDPRRRVIGQSGQANADKFRLFRRYPGGQNYSGRSQQSSEDLGELIDGFVLTEHRFGQAGAEGAVMVDSGGFQDLHRPETEPVKSLVDLDFTGPNLLEKGCNAIVHSWEILYGVRP